MGQLISWEQGPDGCIYMVRSGFERNAAVYLTRFRPNDIGNRAAWQHYDNGSRGESYFPILDQKVLAGKMSLRFIRGCWDLRVCSTRRPPQLRFAYPAKLLPIGML